MRVILKQRIEGHLVCFCFVYWTTFIFMNLKMWRTFELYLSILVTYNLNQPMQKLKLGI